MIIILFGVAGAGKSLIGSCLASKLGWKFYDADQFHTSANIEKMRQGISLTDEGREPWLEKLIELLRTLTNQDEDAVLACSALKESYRQRLKFDEEIKLVFLKGEYTLIEQRLRKRRGHFMNPALLRSQFEALEVPENGVLVVDVTPSPTDIVTVIRSEMEI